jgi:hypothetical protein
VILITDLKFEVAECRFIITQSKDGSIICAEDVNGNFVVLTNKEVIGIYQFKADALAEFERKEKKT